jgi:hypothetical protein
VTILEGFFNDFSDFLSWPDKNLPSTLYISIIRLFVIGNQLLPSIFLFLPEEFS